MHENVLLHCDVDITMKYCVLQDEASESTQYPTVSMSISTSPLPLSFIIAGEEQKHVPLSHIFTPTNVNTTVINTPVTKLISHLLSISVSSDMPVHTRCVSTYSCIRWPDQSTPDVCLPSAASDGQTLCSVYPDVAHILVTFSPHCDILRNNNCIQQNPNKKTIQTGKSSM